MCSAKCIITERVVCTVVDRATQETAQISSLFNSVCEFKNQVCHLARWDRNTTSKRQGCVRHDISGTSARRFSSHSPCGIAKLRRNVLRQLTPAVLFLESRCARNRPIAAASGTEQDAGITGWIWKFRCMHSEWGSTVMS